MARGVTGFEAENEGEKVDFSLSASLLVTDARSEQAPAQCWKE